MEKSDVPDDGSSGGRVLGTEEFCSPKSFGDGRNPGTDGKFTSWTGNPDRDPPLFADRSSDLTEFRKLVRSRIADSESIQKEGGIIDSGYVKNAVQIFEGGYVKKRPLWTEIKQSLLLRV